ncbi:MAG: hypothetical protein WCO56_17150 [Verrucomicrobiota bacterium]
MKTIPYEEAEAIWQSLLETPPEHGKKFMDRLLNMQPALVVYLSTLMESEKPTETQSTYFFIGIAALQVILTKYPKLPAVTPDELVEAEERNIEFLSKLDNDPPMKFGDNTATLINNYNQMPLLGIVLEALMEGNEDTMELVEEESGMALLRIKSMIDCLDAKLN